MDVPVMTVASNKTVASVSKNNNDASDARSTTFSDRQLAASQSLSLSGEDATEDDEEDQNKMATTPTNYDHDQCLVDADGFVWPILVEKSLIVHRDENGFGLVLKGHAPVYVEHVHENGAAWRAGVRPHDRISRVNGVPVRELDHKEVVLMFKSCTRFVGLTLMSCIHPLTAPGAGECGDNIAQAPKITMLKQLGHMHHHQQTSSKSLKSSDYQRLRLRRQETDKSCASQRLHHHSRFFANESAANLYSQLANGRNLSSTLKKSLLHESDYTKQLVGRQQSAGARRSEIVTHSHNQYYLNSQGQLPVGCANKHLQEPGAAIHRLLQHNHSLRSTTNYLSPAQSSFTGSDANKQGTTSNVCPNCGAHNNSTNHHQEADLVVICANCQFQRSFPETDQARGLKGYRSMRDPHQHQHQQQHHMQQAESNNHYQMQRQQHQPQFNFKLTQSASTNSLPGERQPGGAGNRAAGLLSSSSAATSLRLNASVGGAGSSTTASSSCSGSIKRPTTNKRLEIIREFIDTEKTHTDRLRCLDKLFYRPLKAGGYMTAEQLRAVFSCHRSLFKIHHEILRILQSANYNLYAEPMIGSALLEIFESDLRRRLERAACAFCAAQSTNTELLNKLTRPDTKVGEFLSQVTRQQMVGRLGIKDLLASCFQRLTKYPLLLENLLKATPIAPPPAASATRRRVPSETSTSEQQVSDDLGQKVLQVQPVGGDLAEQVDQVEQEETEEERNARRMLAISLAEEREFIERALKQSRQILVRVNESVKVAMSHNKLKEIWKRTDKYPGVPLIDITKQQVIHEGLLTLRLAKRSFDVYVLLLNDYLIILTREGQDKYRLKFFAPDGKSSSYSSSNQTQSVYSPVFVIDEHLTTRDAATDENGFYLLCKRKDDSRIYEFASRSPAERIKWRDRIQWTIDRQMSKANRRASCESTITKSSSEISAKQESEQDSVNGGCGSDTLKVPPPSNGAAAATTATADADALGSTPLTRQEPISGGAGETTSSAVTSGEQTKTAAGSQDSAKEPTKIEGTISYVEDDGIVMPYKMESSWAMVEKAVQVTIFDSNQRELIQSN